MMFLAISSSIANTTGGSVSSSSGVSAELVMSALALIISLVTAYMEYSGNKRINGTNLEATFYKDIYFEYLLKKIPTARQEIRYSEQKIHDVEALIDVLNAMRQDSLFFKYKDKVFYERLKGSLQKLEDYLVGTSGKKYELDDFTAAVEEINKKIEEIYDCIMKQYNGE